MSSPLVRFAAATALCTIPLFGQAQSRPATAPAAATPPAAAAGPTANTGAAANTNATAPAAVTAGLTVKDKTGAAIGQITDVKPDAKGVAMATIKMGTDTFQVPTTTLAVQDGAAVINLTQADIAKQLHPPKS